MKTKTTWGTILLHLCYWAPSIYSLATMPSLYEKLKHVTGYKNDHQLIAIQAGILVSFISFYIAHFLLFPLISKKRPLAFASYGFLTVIGVSILGLMILNPDQYTDQERLVIGPMIVISLPSSAIRNILIACLIRGTMSWYTDIRYKQQLEKQNLETNLALLKAQINPHFLFNTLNNIDILIEKDQATASTYLKKLSDILRFTLYETPSETIPLSREVEYIKQYIDLQKIRTNNQDFVNFEVKIDNPDLQIAPMLFIPFVENAFKHSTNKKIGNAIHISIGTSRNSVRFNCSNAYEADATKTQEQSGLGLELIKSRLQLLYKENYQLDINKTSDRFTVDLSIDLL